MSALDAYLPFGLTSDSLLVLLLAVMAFTVVAAVWFGLIERNPLESRARHVATRRNELKTKLLSNKPRTSRRAESVSFMKRVVDTLRLMQDQQASKLRDRLAQAGYRSQDAIIIFLFFKAVSPIAFGVVSFLGFYVIKIGNFQPALNLVIVCGGCLFGFLAPDLFVSNNTAKRQQRLARALPDGLDLLVICAESGLSLDAGLERVAREIGNASPDLAEELQLTSVELGFLPERRHALLNLNRRTNLAAIRGVVNTLVQTEKYGTPLSQSLRVLANEFRDQRLLRAEEKAARLPATLTVPMIVFILPVLFIVLIGPAIISVMDNMMS
ncbi:MAG: type II secretion system F family protein [Alphaproteobacteria bacterium]